MALSCLSTLVRCCSKSDNFALRRLREEGGPHAPLASCIRCSALFSRCGRRASPNEKHPHSCTTGEAEGWNFGETRPGTARRYSPTLLLLHHIIISKERARKKRRRRRRVAPATCCERRVAAAAARAFCTCSGLAFVTLRLLRTHVIGRACVVSRRYSGFRRRLN